VCLLRWGILLLAIPAAAHDPITTKLTWNREISRIVYAHCAVCHRPGGAAFSLMTYPESRPWAAAISEEVRERRMPPWGAVKGFGEFRNDQALSQEQVDSIAQWVEGGAPEGEPKDLPPKPKLTALASVPRAARQFAIEGEYTLQRPVLLGGILPNSALPDSLQITAHLPDGNVEPLLWLYGYQPRYSHPFLLRTPLLLPSGTVIRGVPAGARITLLAAPPAREQAHRNGPYSRRPSAETAPTTGKSARAGK
jgi:mono/diheme cytochrome c family protein